MIVRKYDLIGFWISVDGGKTWDLVRENKQPKL